MIRIALVITGTIENTFIGLSLISVISKIIKVITHKPTEVRDSVLYSRQLKGSPIILGREPDRKLPWM